MHLTIVSLTFILALGAAQASHARRLQLVSVVPSLTFRRYVPHPRYRTGFISRQSRPSQEEIIPKVPIIPSPKLFPPTTIESIINRIYDYIYPLVLQKCLIKITSSVDHKPDENIRMFQIVHPLVQVFSLDYLNEYMRQSNKDDIRSTCEYRVQEEMRDWADLLVRHYKESTNDEFRQDNEIFNKYASMIEDDSLPYYMFRYAFEQEKNGLCIYNTLYRLEPFAIKYVRYLASHDEHNAA